jgi:CDP-diacylglycerol--glycerol-3-phosphate 3-phosphatidyltransferase
MLSRWVRTWDSRLLAPLMLMLVRCHVTPNWLTVLSLIVVVASGVLLMLGQRLTAGLVFWLGVLLDGLDGELARATRGESRAGAFLDSICDHCGDFAVSLGLLLYVFNQGQPFIVLLIFAALFGSMLGSQIRSRAGMLGIDTKDIGFFTRFERAVILGAGLLLDQILWALAALAILSNFSALQRLYFTWQALRIREHPANPTINRLFPPLR